MDMAEFFTPYEIEKAIGAGKFAEIIEKHIAGFHPEEDGDGNRRIRYDWDYRDQECLDGWVSEVVFSGSIYRDPMNPSLLYASYPADLPFEERSRLDESRICETADPRWNIMEYVGYASLDWTYNHRRWVFDQIAEGLYSDHELSELLTASSGRAPSLRFTSWDLGQYLEDELRVYADVDLESHMGDVTLSANIAFAVGSEWSRDFTNMYTWAETLGESIEEGSLLQSGEIARSNSLTWLLSTQGYTWADYVEQKAVAEGGGKWESRFLESVDRVLGNTGYSMNQLTLCAKMPFGLYGDFVTGKTNLKVDPDQPYFTMTLFNKWNGSGSLEDFVLEKPFVIGKNVLFEVSCEPPAHVEQRFHYSVNSVYGLIGEAWSDCLARTDEEPAGIPDVDFDAIERAVSRYEEIVESVKKHVEAPAPPRPAPPMVPARPQMGAPSRGMGR